ncbi:MAG: hypothetical protein MJ231_08205 [bacterium]|nr:hypothetical protein [bacterium]
MPKGKYLNADHEIIGKLLDQMDGLSKKDKIEAVICAIYSHDFKSPEQNSVFNHLSPTPYNKGSNSVASSTAKKINEYLTIELEEDAEVDSDTFMEVKFGMEKAKDKDLDVSTVYHQKNLDYNIDFSDKYYDKEELDIKQVNINLVHTKEEPVSKKQVNEDFTIRKKTNFINENINDFNETFGPHFKGRTIQEIIEKDLSRNSIAKMFRWDSKQISDVFKALKEIDNPKSMLSDGEKAVTLRNALDEYLEYKRPDIQTQLNKCENDLERKKLIDQNNIDFRRYEFCRKLAVKMKDFPYEYRTESTARDLDYKKYTAYEKQNDAILHGIDHIEKKPGFSLSKFFKEKIAEPISDFFSSIFSRRSKSEAKTSSTSISLGPNLSERNIKTNDEFLNEVEQSQKEKDNNKQIDRKPVDFSNIENKIEAPKEELFTQKDKTMIKDLFYNSTGNDKDKLMEIALLTRVGIIQYDKGNKAAISHTLGGMFKPVRCFDSKTADSLHKFSKAIANFLGIDENNVPTKEEFGIHLMDLSDKTDSNLPYNRNAMAECYVNKDGLLKTSVLEVAGKYDNFLGDILEGKLNSGKKRLNIENEEYKQEHIDLKEIGQPVKQKQEEKIM